MDSYRIGTVAKMLGMTVDTLRYYEKIGLMPHVARSASGIRAYSDEDIQRLYFIQRAQKMNFSLAEIGQLVQLREDPVQVQQQLRVIASRKLDEVEARLEELQALRDELGRLIEQCEHGDTCPITQGFDRPDIHPDKR